MKRRPAQTTDNEDRREHPRRRHRPDAAEHDDSEDRTCHQQQAGVPSIGQRAKPKLRHRVRHLETHRQCAGHRQRQAEPRDQEREERRVEVAVRIDDEVRRGGGQDCRMQGEALQRHILRRRPMIRSRASSNSVHTQDRCGRGQHRQPDPYGHGDARRTQPRRRSRQELCQSRRQPSRPRLPSARTRQGPWRGPQQHVARRCRQSPCEATPVASPALISAASEVPSASPRYPRYRTSNTLKATLTSTEATLTMTGMRLSPARKTSATRCAPRSSRRGRWRKSATPRPWPPCLLAVKLPCSKISR